MFFVFFRVNRVTEGLLDEMDPQGGMEKMEKTVNLGPLVLLDQRYTFSL